MSNVETVLVRNVTKRSFNGIGSYQITSIPKEHLDRYLLAWFEEYTGNDETDLDPATITDPADDTEARRAFLIAKWVKADKYGKARIIKESDDLWYWDQWAVVDPANLTNLDPATITDDGTDDEENDEDDEEIIDDGADATTDADDTITPVE